MGNHLNIREEFLCPVTLTNMLQQVAYESCDIPRTWNEWEKIYGSVMFHVAMFFFLYTMADVFQCSSWSCLP